MNGVMSASISAVSSHRVASVTCTPHVIVPLGWAAAGAASHKVRATRAGSPRGAKRMIMALPGSREGLPERGRDLIDRALGWIEHIHHADEAVDEPRIARDRHGHPRLGQ